MTRTGCCVAKPGRAWGGPHVGTPDQGAAPTTDAVPSPESHRANTLTKETASRGKEGGEPPLGERGGISAGARLGLDPQIRVPRPSPRSPECGLVWKCN